MLAVRPRSCSAITQVPPPRSHSGSWGVETGAGVEKNVEEKERIHSYLALLFFFLTPSSGFLWALQELWTPLSE